MCCNFFYFFSFVVVTSDSVVVGSSVVVYTQQCVYIYNRVMRKKKVLPSNFQLSPIFLLNICIVRSSTSLPSCIPYRIDLYSLVVCFWWWWLLLLCPLVTYPITSWSRCFEDTTTCHKSCFMMCVGWWL
jgi:hypothetical protein